MTEAGPNARASLLPGIVALTLASIYVSALFAAEKQALIIGLLALAIAAVLAVNRLGWLGSVRQSFADREDILGALAVVAAFAVALYFHENHFVLLLFVTVLLYTVATLGLNIQFGYAGVLNFAGASFFGIGAYTSAVLNAHTALPHSPVLPIGRAAGGRSDRCCCCRRAHARPLRRDRDHSVRAVAEDLPRGQRRARRPAGLAGQGHEHPRLVAQRRLHDRRFELSST